MTTTDKFIRITHLDTGERLWLSNGPGAVHPVWVHRQCHTTTEAELQQAMADNIENWEPAAAELGPDDQGMEVFEADDLINNFMGWMQSLPTDARRVVLQRVCIRPE